MCNYIRHRNVNEISNRINLMFKNCNEVKRSKPNLDHWSDTDILSLRESVLQQALETLGFDTYKFQAKSEILMWILNDQVHPFSFALCCSEVGLDYQEVKILLLRNLKSSYPNYNCNSLVEFLLCWNKKIKH